MEERIMERWNKAYWTIRGFFKPGSPAAEQLKPCDNTADLPELWRIFNVHYVAAANFSGLFSLFYQLTGPTYVQKNLLSEFVRQNDLQKRIIQLKDQANSNFMATPTKDLFETPFPRRIFEVTPSTPVTSKESTPDDPSDGGENEEEDSSPDFYSDRPRLLEADDEWRRVMTSLFNMVNQKQHGPSIH